MMAASMGLTVESADEAVGVATVGHVTIVDFAWGTDVAGGRIADDAAHQMAFVGVAVSEVGLVAITAVSASGRSGWRPAAEEAARAFGFSRAITEERVKKAARGLRGIAREEIVEKSHSYSHLSKVRCTR